VQRVFRKLILVRLIIAALLIVRPSQAFFSCSDVALHFIWSQDTPTSQYYSLEYPFNFGGFGTVHYGIMPERNDGITYPEIGRPGARVVIKVPIVYGDSTRDIRSKNALEHEGNMLRRVFRIEARRRSHLSIRGVYDPVRGALVMENIENPMTLEQWMQDPMMTPTRQVVDSLSSQLRQALQILQEAGIVHGDLTPRNILMTPQGQIRIIDFGLAAERGSHAPYLRGQRLGVSRGDRYGSLVSMNQRLNRPAEFSDDESYIHQIIRDLNLSLSVHGAHRVD